MNSPQIHALTVVLRHVGPGRATNIRTVKGTHGWEWRVFVPGDENVDGAFYSAFTGTLDECHTL